MSSLIPLILFISILIFEVVILVCATKRKQTRIWTALFILEVTSLLLTHFSFVYFNRLQGYGFFPGFTYLFEILSSTLAFFLYLIMLLISACIRIITYELNLKKQGKKYAHPFRLILAVALILVGVFSVNYEVSKNWGLKPTTGIVTGFSDSDINIGGKIEQEAIITFYVDDKKYQDTYFLSDVSVGDKLDIYYYPNDYYSTDYNSTTNGAYSVTPFYANNKIIYIPCFALSGIIIFFRFKTFSLNSRNDATNNRD